jgi:iron complex outermembrane receptor protein
MHNETSYFPQNVRPQVAPRVAALGLLWLVGVTAAAQAQTSAPATAGAEGPAPTSELSEITVTATRRSERENDVPISLTALTPQALDTRSVRQIDDVMDLVPGLTFVRNGAAPTGNNNDEQTDVSIRGIESSAGTSTTGIYIDDTPMQARKIGYGTQDAYPAIFDLERVEVLRGPQGTLFGASSEGGTIRFIQPSPSLQNSTGYVRSELATTKNGDPSYNEGAAFGAPIIDGVLGFRVSASFQHDGGWVNREDYPTGQITDTRSNWHQTVTARLALTWKPDDSLSITPSFYYQELYVHDTGIYWPTLSNPQAGQFVNGNIQPNQSRDPFYVAAVKVDWNLPWASFFSNTSFFSRNQYSYIDYTQLLGEIYLGTSFNPGGYTGTAYTTDVQNNFTQEFRLQSNDDSARLSWTTGLFLTHMNENSIENITQTGLEALTGGTLCAAIACPGGVIYAEPYDRVIDKQAALFGEANLKITDTFKATAGVRVSHDTFQGQTLYGGPFLGQASIVTDSPSTSENPVTPKGVLSWQPNRDNLVYASAQKGFRVGGVNPGVGAACDANLALLGLPVGANGLRNAPAAYNSDSLWSYEIGSKNGLLGNRLQINSSLYWINWRDIQQNVYLGECGLSYTANLGQAHSYGGDIAVAARATESLTLNLSAAFTHANYTKTVCATSSVVCTGADAAAAPVVSKGDALIGAPWKFIASVDYLFPSFLERQPYVHVEYNYSTAQAALLAYQDPRNAVNDPETASLPVITDLLARGGLRWGAMDVSLYGQNLTNARPVVAAFRDFAAPYVEQHFTRSVQPRTIGITAIYRY